MNTADWAPTIVAILAAGGAWVSARHGRAAADHNTDRTTDETHHKTESETLLGINAALQTRLNQVEGRLYGLGEKVGEVRDSLGSVHDQVSNNHSTNLRDDLTEALSMLNIVTTYLKDVPNMGDFRRLKADIRKDMGDIRGKVADIEQRLGPL